MKERGKQKKSSLSGLPHLLVILVVVGAAYYLSLPYSPPVQTAPKENGVTELLINMGGWTPNVVYAKAGKPITLRIVTWLSERSMSDNIHSFVMDDPKIDLRFLAGETKTVTLPALKPGEYAFWCVTCCGGKASRSMHGTLIVQP